MNSIIFTAEEARILTAFKSLSPDCQDALLALEEALLKEQEESDDSKD